MVNTLQQSYFQPFTHEQISPSFEPQAHPHESAPNVLLIVLDDAGYADLGCFGSELETPNFDRLAAEGLTYTNFHTTTLCSPSRASLLTGRNHHSVGMRMLANVDSGLPSGRGLVVPAAANMAEVLGPAGYQTMMIGKWHLAPMSQTGPCGPYDHWPLRRGFDRFYGFMEGATDHFYPELTEDNRRIDPPRPPEEGYHLTTDLVDHAIQMIRDTRSHAPRKRFFTYLALGAPHAPHQAPKGFLDLYRGRFDEGYDLIRERRFERQIAEGIVPSGTSLPPRNPGVPAWDELSDDQKVVSARLQEAYAAMLTHADYEVGRLLDELESQGVLDDTLVILLSDNGAAAEGGPLGAVSRIRFFNELPEDPAFNLDYLDTVGGPDGDSHYPTGWAQAGNTPGRWFKYHTHSGGVRDPLIIRWPGQVPTAARSGQFHHIIDIAPTILSAAGVDMPATVKGVPQMPVHGVDMSYTFTNTDAPSRRRVQHFEMFGNRGIYADGWKAVTRHIPGQPFTEKWELYHLDEDFSEARNLAAEHPDRLQRLVELWHVEAGKYDVLPLDDRSTELFAKPAPPTSPYARDEFIYYDGASHIHPKATPPVVDRSFCIEVTLEPWKAGDCGVLVVHGNRWGGYGLYVVGDELIFEYNYCGEITLMRSGPLPEGARTLGYRFERKGRLRGRGALTVDGTEVAETIFDKTLSFISMTGMDIGHNPNAPFSRNFTRPFKWTGTIRSVRFSLGDGPPSEIPWPDGEG